MLIKSLSADHASLLNQIHAECVDPPWSADSFQQLLHLPTTTGLGAWEGEKLLGFILFSMVMDQSEILTFAVRPSEQRKGVGKALLYQALFTIKIFGIEECHLEVNENNISAIALYEKFNFEMTGRRDNYYKNSRGEISSALLMNVFLDK